MKGKERLRRGNENLHKSGLQGMKRKKRPGRENGNLQKSGLQGMKRKKRPGRGNGNLQKSGLQGKRGQVLREILHLRNSPLLGYLRMRQVFRRQVFRKG